MRRIWIQVSTLSAYIFLPHSETILWSLNSLMTIMSLYSFFSSFDLHKCRRKGFLFILYSSVLVPYFTFRLTNLKSSKICQSIFVSTEVPWILSCIIVCICMHMPVHFFACPPLMTFDLAVQLKANLTAGKTLKKSRVLTSLLKVGCQRE